jgi:hypothetical protein
MDYQQNRLRAVLFFLHLTALNVALFREPISSLLIQHNITEREAV